MEQKLIAIDLDGTTLNENSQITPKTKEVLTKATADYQSGLHSRQ